MEVFVITKIITQEFEYPEVEVMEVVLTSEKADEIVRSYKKESFTTYHVERYDVKE